MADGLPTLSSAPPAKSGGPWHRNHRTLPWDLDFRSRQLRCVLFLEYDTLATFIALGIYFDEMNNHHHPNSHPHVGATFYPGGVDDFYMPEVISPAPQRYVEMQWPPLTSKTICTSQVDQAEGTNSRLG